MRLFVLALLVVLAGSPVFADIVASTTVPYSLGGTVTSIDLTSVALGSTNFSGIGFSVAFAGSDPDKGVVLGPLPGKYAVPIAGPSTPWSDQGGKFFSTGTGGSSITITFSTAQSGLAFLWGSVDTYNDVQVSFNSGAEIYTGSDAALAASISPSGFQGFGGSAWVGINPDIPGGTFTTVTFTSSAYSLEFAGVQASTEGFGVPDGGMTVMLLGGALVGLETLRRKFRV
jgi:hypothetical protein